MTVSRTLWTGDQLKASACLLRVIVRMKLVEWTVLEGETEVFGENLPRRHFVHHKSHLPDPGAKPGRRGGKPATNRFSYVVAQQDSFNHQNQAVLKYIKTTGDWKLCKNISICSTVIKSQLRPEV
jgi:hypothetical protein